MTMNPAEHASSEADVAKRSAIALVEILDTLSKEGHHYDSTEYRRLIDKATKLRLEIESNIKTLYDIANKVGEWSL